MHTLVRTCLTLAAAIALVPGVGTAQAASLKFAYIDSRVVLDRAPGRAAAESTFQKEYDAAQVKIRKMQDTLEAMASAYQKSAPTLTAVNRELREKEIREKQQTFENSARLLELQMQQRQNELVQPMMNQIREVLDALRKEDGYTFIFDIGTNASVIVAADSTLDVTERVVSRLKPIPVTAARPDSTRPAGVRAQPAGVVPKKPTP